MNHIQMFEGNLTRDPELRFTQSGTPLARFGIAVNDRRGREDGEERAVFWNVTAFKGLAENVAESLKKGDRVVVLGRVRSWSRELRDEDGKPIDVAQFGIDAVDVAASLMWATVDPVRTNRSNADGPSASNGSSSPPAAAPAGFGVNEEPF